MSLTLTTYDIEKATGRVNCGGDNGTCFLISPTLAITAAHVVQKKQDEQSVEKKPEDEAIQISIDFLKISEEPIWVKATILDYGLSTVDDIAILELDNPVELDKYIPLMCKEVANGTAYQVFGYPNKEYTAGKKFAGKISRTNDFHTKWDLDLDLEKPFDTRGASGAALVMGNYAVGLVISQLDESLHAISFKKVKEFLEKNSISFSEQGLDQDIPEMLKAEVDETKESVNEPVIEELDDCLGNMNGGYALLSGSPGSGKTTIITQYDAKRSKIEIAGRYFVKVPSDSEALANRATKERLLEWMESVCFKILQNKSPEKSERNLIERVQQLGLLLKNLGNYYKKRETIGVLAIDGLDDADKPKGKLADFLSILPNTLPEHLIILFSCTNKAVLPNNFQAQISKENEVKVTPLGKDKKEHFIRQKLAAADIQLSPEQITLLGKKSEGHPLYLRYLTTYIIRNKQRIEEQGNLNNWLLEIPTIDGNIKVYYKTIWNTIKNNPEEVKIIGTISRLRQKAPIDSIPQMLSEDSREQWDLTFDKVVHLLSYEDGEAESVGIYHSSFGDFFKNSTKQQNDIIHQRIAQYCETHPETSYGLSNVIYHFYNSNQGNKKKAIELCQQEWVDNCALNSVSPDFILTDVRAVLRLCFDFSLSVEVIRVLLLLQRVRFRYDEIFKEYAFELAEALIAMGKADEAVTYIIRNENLLVGIRDGAYFFQKLIECEAYDGASKILDVLESLTASLIREDNADQDVIFNFIHTISLEIAFNPKKAMHKFSHFNNFFSKAFENLGNNRETIIFFKDIIGSFHNAYLSWKLNTPMLPSKVEKLGFKLDEKTAGFTALVLIELKQLKHNTYANKEIASYQSYFSEIETAIDRFSYYDDHRKPIISVLISESKRTDIVEKIIKEILPDSFDFSIRGENGVNANVSEIQKVIKNNTYSGYLNQSSHIKPFPRNINPDSWEANLKVIIQKTGYFFGRAYYLKATDDDKQLASLILNFKQFLPEIKFPLFARMYWRENRAYALPEEIMPVIYRKITEFILEFCPDYVPNYTDFILKNPQNQLGLFTEGYRNSLQEIATQLVPHPNHRKAAFRVLEHLETYIYRHVQNRWERVPELMNLAELYARISAEEKAEKIFKMMLDSSMGISWYKEAQLDLITTAVENLYDDSSDFSQLPTLAGHLDFASGEMTFQRYIRMEKERFIQSLIHVDALDKAIQYFKQVTLSTPKDVQERAESSVIDTPVKGEGYELGAREIEEEGGIRNLLDALGEQISPYFKWVLAELFVSDDIHYIDNYAKFLGKSLTELENRKSTEIDFLLERLIGVISTKIDKPFQGSFISDLTSETSLEISSKLEKLLLNAKIIEPQSETVADSENRHEKPETEKDILAEYLLKAKEELTFGNKTKARSLIKEGWQKKGENGLSILDGNPKESFEVLIETSNSDADILATCEDLILNDPYKAEWVLAAKLIPLLSKKIESPKKQKILQTVENHLELMIRTSEQNSAIFSRYAWLKDASPKENIDIQIAKFIIWLLNYPNFNSDKKIIELIIWLCSVEQKIILPLLVEEAFSKQPNISSELAMYILFSVVSEGHYAVVWEQLKTREMDILEEDHFMKKYALLKILTVIADKDATAIPILEGLKATFPTDLSESVDVEPDWVWLPPIQNAFDYLLEYGFINGKICRRLEKMVQELCKEFDIAEADLSRINVYYKRSFFNQEYFISPVEYIPRYALNKAVASNVPLNQVNSAVNQLCLIYNFFN